MKTNETADALAARVKHFEDVSAKTVLDENLPICVRLDGKAFHSFTKGLDKPFDERFSKAMISTMNYLLEKTNAQLAYTQSDEISLVYFKAADYQQAYFGAREQKLASVLASMTTAKFNQEVFKNIPEKAETLAFFDCRVWNVPSLDDAADVFKWRQLDAVKNSISVAAHTNFSNQETLRKSSKEKIAMLATIGIDWHGTQRLSNQAPMPRANLLNCHFLRQHLSLKGATLVCALSLKMPTFQKFTGRKTSLRFCLMKFSKITNDLWKIKKRTKNSNLFNV